MIAPVLTFFIFFAAIYGAYWFFVVRPEEHAASALKHRLRKAQAERRHQSKLLKQVKSFSSVGPLDSILQHARSPLAGLQGLIEQSGMRLSVGTLLLASGTLMLLGFIVTQR